MAWEKVKLGDICESISDGDHLPPPKSVDGIPFVTISNVNSSNQFDFKNTMFAPQEYYEKLDEKRKPRINDILYSVVGSFGIPVFIKENRPFVFQRHIAILRPNESRIHPRYLYYKMLSKDFYMKADAVAIGAAQRTISLTSLRNMEISIPCKDSQKRIADILSAYDNLIENNQKQIKLLEEAAQRLYKQWFIDLRFPGHETTPIVDGLPEGWRKESVKDCLEMHIGGGWGKDNPDGKNTFAGKVIRGTDINDVKQGNFNDVPTRYHTANDMQKRKLAEYDIVFELSNGNINNIGRSLFVNQLLLENCGENTICASFCKLLRSKNKYLAMLLYLEIQDMQNSGRMLPYKKHGSNGINNFDFEGFLNHEFLIPSNKDILALFFDIMKKIANIQKSFSLLIESRDRLLPKLMNGELEV